MRSKDSLQIFAPGTLVGASGLVIALLGLQVQAQTAPPVATRASSPAKFIPANLGSIAWTQLTARQKVSLAPLEKSWNKLSEGQQRKWMAISESYPSLGQAEQEKLHSRMAEWAALSPNDREAARLNFAQSKTIAKSDRAANWEAYQALTPEERKKLAQGSKLKPVGAAVAVKPVAPEKLTVVPVTRHTPEEERAAAVSQWPINRNTLLPLLPATAATQPLAVPPKP